MNTKVFVLGAGASMPYGFPDGRKLVADIVQVLKDNEKGIQDQFPLNDPEINFKSLIEKLSSPSIKSIDRFLANHADVPIYDKLGRAGIVTRISNYESDFRTNRLTQNDSTSPTGMTPFKQISDWMEFLIDKIFEHCMYDIDSISKIPIYLISFNYDRLFEYKLAEAIYANFNVSRIQAHEASWIFCSEHLIHVHGKIGDFKTIPFGDSEIVDDPDSFLKGFKLVHEEFTREDKRRVREWFVAADEIHYLGFGYLYDNLDKLIFENIGIKKVSGTMLGLGLGERRDRVRYFLAKHAQTFNKAHFRFTCLEYLKEAVTFWQQ